MNGYESGLHIIQRMLNDGTSQSENLQSLFKGIYPARPINFQMPKDLRHTEEVLRQAVDIWEALVDQDPNSVGSQADLALMYNLLALVKRYSGNNADAIATLVKSGELWKTIVDAYPGVPNYRAALATFYNNLSQFQSSMEKMDEATQSIGLSLALYDGLLREFPHDASFVSGRVTSARQAASVLERIGQYDDAISLRTRLKRVS